jgi:hypothetical protein
MSIGLALLCAVVATGVSGCAAPGSTPPGGPTDPDQLGSVTVRLSIGGGVRIDAVGYEITGPAAYDRTGSLDVSNSTTIVGTIGGLPAGAGYQIALTATDADHLLTGCEGTAPFDIMAGTTSTADVHLTCHEAPRPAPPAVPVPLSARVALAIVLAALGARALQRRRRPF